MKTSKWILCNLILQLDRLPRYGRYYELRPQRHPDDSEQLGPAIWTWQRYGHWGINILDRLGWLWPWMDECEKRGLMEECD
jgi:hypothetical protein